MKEKFKRYLIIALLFILVPFVFIVSFAKTVETMPENAIVLLSDESKLYYSPMFYSDYRINTGDSVRLSTVSEAKLKKYKADKRGRNEGYFKNEQGSIIWEWLDSGGILKQKHRWNPDGSWNW